MSAKSKFSRNIFYLSKRLNQYFHNIDVSRCPSSIFIILLLFSGHNQIYIFSIGSNPFDPNHNTSHAMLSKQMKLYKENIFWIYRQFYYNSPYRIPCGISRSSGKLWSYFSIQSSKNSVVNPLVFHEFIFYELWSVYTFTSNSRNSFNKNVYIFKEYVIGIFHQKHWVILFSSRSWLNQKQMSLFQR